MEVLSKELRISLAIAFALTVFYLFIARDGVPRSGSWFGYTVGILGFLLMLGAEVLHSWRKQQKGAKMGKIRTWLQAHIIIGLVGPYLVLLHSAWQLNGVAGIAMLLTFLMVASGFLCSYIYPALPRNVEGAELSLPEIEVQIDEASSRLRAWLAENPEAVSVMGPYLDTLTVMPREGDVMSVLMRAFLHRGYQHHLREELRRLQSAGIEHAEDLGNLLNRRYMLETQVHSLAAARKLLGQARTVHIALGAVLFTLAMIHIGAALYYSTFAH